MTVPLEPKLLRGVPPIAGASGEPAATLPGTPATPPATPPPGGVKPSNDPLKQIDPGGDDPVARLEWLNKVKPLADKSKGTPPPGAPRSPAPAGTASGDDEQARRAQSRMTRRNF